MTASVMTEESTLMQARLTGRGVWVSQNPISKLYHVHRHCLLHCTLGRQVWESASPQWQRSFVESIYKLRFLHLVIELIIIGFLGCAGAVHPPGFQALLKLGACAVGIPFILIECLCISVRRSIFRHPLIHLCFLPLPVQDIGPLLNDFLEVTITQRHSVVAGIQFDDSAILAYAQQHNISVVKFMVHGWVWTSNNNTALGNIISVGLRIIAFIVCVCAPPWCHATLNHYSFNSNGSGSYSMYDGQLWRNCGVWQASLSMYAFVVMWECISMIFCKNRCC